MRNTRKSVKEVYISEKNTEKTQILLLPLKALVFDLTSTKAQYAMIGIVTDKSKELIIQRKDKSKLDLSSAIIIDGEEFVGWRSGTKLQYRETEDREFVRIYCYIKKTS